VGADRIDSIPAYELIFGVQTDGEVNQRLPHDSVLELLSDFRGSRV